MRFTAPSTAIGGGSGDLVSTNNLSDLSSAAAARTNLSLGNVTNTSDANKPVSTAQQTALDAKQNLDTQLTDLAGLAYASNALKVVRVNAGATAFELAAAGGGSGDLLAANNLSDVASAATARTNLAVPGLSGGNSFTGGQTITGALAATETLQMTSSAKTVSAPVGDFTDRWNAAGVTFTAFQVNVTNDASASGSKLFDFKLAGTTVAKLTKDGRLEVGSGGAGLIVDGIGNAVLASALWQTNYTCQLYDTGVFAFSSSGLFAAADTGLSRNAAGVTEFNNGTRGTLRDWKARRAALTEYMDVTQMTAPSAPGAGVARLYAEDVGGKVALMVLFPSGAAQQIAIEP